MELVDGPAVCGEVAWEEVYFLGPSVPQGQLCTAAVFSMALTSKLVPSERNTFCYFEHVTDSFEI